MKQQTQTKVNKFLSELKSKILQELKFCKSNITHDILADLVCDILIDHTSKKYQIALQLIGNYQETILDQQEQIRELRKKIEIQNQLSYSFFKTINRQNEHEISFLNPSVVKPNKRDSSLSHIKAMKKSSLLACQNNSQENSCELLLSPICDLNLNQIDKAQNRRKGSATSRSKLSSSRYQTSEFANELEQDQKQKNKAFAKLRKLQMYVYGKQNVGRKDRNQKIWDCGVSPTKKYYQQQNDSLKAIQNNLITHLSLLQKFKGIPSIESLMSREQNLKKREKLLNQKSESLEQKQINLNKKHAQILKQQRTSKIL